MLDDAIKWILENWMNALLAIIFLGIVLSVAKETLKDLFGGLFSSKRNRSDGSGKDDNSPPSK